jgi:hypothetical protein
MFLLLSLVRLPEKREGGGRMKGFACVGGAWRRSSSLSFIDRPQPSCLDDDDKAAKGAERTPTE